MRTVIVNDASCLIDLWKGQLLHVLARLPYRFVVPLPIRASELLGFTAQEWRLLDDGGMETFDLPPSQMANVFALKQQHGRLSANDCFCLVTAQSFEEAILLTGDRLLRTTAEAAGVPVHGVLWVVDELHAANACDKELLATALERWRDDLSVFLPDALIAQRLRRLR